MKDTKWVGFYDFENDKLVEGDIFVHLKNFKALVNYIKNYPHFLLYKLIRLDYCEHDYLLHPNFTTNLYYLEQYLQLEIIKNNPNCIKFIDNPSEQVQLEAMQLNYHIFQYIKNPTKKVREKYNKLYNFSIICTTY